MRTLIYKRTHSGDPDPISGVFGNADCMKSVRSRLFDAVIGVGGIGREPQRAGIARRLTWVGIGPHKTGDPRRPRVTFDHFLYYGKKGPFFATLAPTLARHIYDWNVRTIMDSLSETERKETERILRTALKSRPSKALHRRANDPSAKRRARNSDRCVARTPASGASVTKASRSSKC